MSILHQIGTHSLVISIVGQCFVLYEVLRARDKGGLRQTGTLIVALLLATVSLQLRPPSPPNLWADSIGVAAGVLFIIPAAEAFRKTRAQRPEKQENQTTEAN